VRHIIIEGPDGSGKSTLIWRLTEALGYEVNAKASDSLTGPVPDLAKWTVDDMARWPSDIVPRIYDRYPVISEPLYGLVVRHNIRPQFDNTGWLADLRLTMYRRAVVVWCLPSLDTVRLNVTSKPNDQMPGVVDNIQHLWHGYHALWRAWGGLSYRWDYATGNFEMLVAEMKDCTR
jgi:hypothetical protein